MKKYIATARMCFMEKGYFGFYYLAGTYLLKVTGMAALMMIWRSLFEGGADMAGFTLGQMLAYTILSALLEPMMNVRTPASSWLHDGAILSLYLRPSSIFGQLVAHTMGGWLMPLGIMAIPAALAAAVCGADLTPASGWFFISMPLAISEGFAVDLLFACMLMRLRNLEWTVEMFRVALTALFTGAVIPFSVLPWGLGSFLELMPLGTLAGAPLSLYVGIGDPARLIAAQVVWNIVIWPLAAWEFERSREKLTSYGG